MGHVKIGRMESILNRVLILLGFGFAGIVVGSAACFAATRLAPGNKTPNLTSPPAEGKAPVSIRLGLYVADLAAIDEAAEDFEIQGYLYASWRDERLIGDARCQARVPLDSNDVWNPQLDIANIRTFRSFASYFFCDPDGNVSWEERFDTVLSNEFYLRRFPFDRQTLLVVVQPFLTAGRANQNPIDFGPKSYATGVNPSAYLSAWKIEKITYQRGFASTNIAAITLPQGRFAIVVDRRSGFYVWKVFLPLALMVIVPWAVFWVSVKEFDWQMKIPISSMLTIVAFDFAIARDLPRVSYLTFLDAVFLATFVFIFLTIVEVVSVHVLVMTNMMPTATRIHRSARWLFPLAFAVLLAIIIPMFLSGAGRPQ